MPSAAIAVPKWRDAAYRVLDHVRRANLSRGPLVIPTEVVETAGEGIEGKVGGLAVSVGSLDFVASKVSSKAVQPFQGTSAAGAAIVAVAINGVSAGEIVLTDNLREGAQALLQNLRNLGIKRIVLATGDRRDVATAIATNLALDAVRAELSPDQKVLVVLSERKNGPVMIVGDGVNDAPALAAADIGVALGARGTAASAEAADVVLLVDSLDGLVPASLEFVLRRSHVAGMRQRSLAADDAILSLTTGRHRISSAD